jgi:autotransporter translocation and assembly factor TamB
VGLLAAAVIVGGAVALSRFIEAHAPAFTRERVETALTAALGRPVRVEGVELHPWRGRLAVRGVTIPDPAPSAPPLLRLRRAEARLGIASLWRGELVVSRVILDGFDVVLDGDAGGGSGFALPDPVPDHVAVGPVTVGLGRLEILSGRVVVAAPRAGRTIELEGMEGTVRPLGGAAVLRLALASVRVVASGVDETVQALEVAGELRGDRIALDSFRARWHGEELTVRGEILGLGADVDLVVDGRLALGPAARLAGLDTRVTGVAQLEGTVRGAMPEPAVTAKVAIPALEAGPVTARSVRGQLAWKDGQLRVQGIGAETLGGTVRGSVTVAPAKLETARAKFTLTGVALEALEALTGQRSGIRATLTVDGDAAGDPRDLARLSASARFESPDLRLPGDLARLGRAAVRGQARLASGGVDVSELEATWPSARLQASGRVGLDGALGLHATAGADLAQIAGGWNVRDVGGRVSVSADVSGSLGQPAARGTVRASSPAYGRTALDAVEIPFALTGDTLRVDGAELRRGASRARLTASARWSGPRAPGRWRDAIVARGDVAASTVRLEDLDVFLPDGWHGTGTFAVTAHVEGTPAAWRATGRLDAARVVVRDQLVEGAQVPFTLTDGGVEARALRARVAGAPVAGGGRWSWDGTGGVQLDLGPVALASLPAAASVGPTEGTARAHVELTAQGGVLNGSAQLTAEKVGVAGLALGRGSGRATVQAGLLNAELSFPEARLHASAAGRLAPGERIALSLRAADVPVAPLAERWAPAAARPATGRMSVVAAGSVLVWQPDAVQVDSVVVTTESLTVAELALGPGTLRATLRDRALSAGAEFPEAQVSATASGRLAPGGTLALTVRAGNVQVAPLARRWAPAGLGRVDGAVTVAAELAIPVADPRRATGRAQLDPVAVTLAGEEWRGVVLLRREPDRVRVERLGFTSRLGAVTASGTVTDAGALDLTADGQIPLAILPAFRPELLEADGVADTRLRIAGTAAVPAITGDGTLRDGRLALRDYPDPIRELRARFTISPRGARITEATATLGGGQLRASGEVVIGEDGSGTYRFAVTAREVAATSLADLQTVWDADLDVAGRGPRAFVRGEARLLRGLYTRDISILRELLQRRPVRVESREGGVHLDLRIQLQDNLVARTSLATLRAGGTLRLQGTTSAPIVFGTVDVREGEITFRKNRWRVLSASARFIDPRRIDPILDVHAETEIRGYDITMTITGPGDNLEIKFAAVPPLAEDEVLALVAFGQTRSQLGQAGAGALVGEAAGIIVDDMFGPSGDSLVRPDVLEVDTSDTGARTVKVGKRLTPNTLVVYSQGITNADERKLRIEYQVFGPLVVAGEQDFRGSFGGDVLLRLRFR